MVLEALLADVAQQLLQLRDVGDAGTAEGLQRIARELAFANVATNAAMEVVGGEAREAHRAGLHAAHAGAEGVLLADGAGDDGLEVHDDVFEEVLGQIGAVEADALVRIAAVVVVPVEQRAGRLAGERERVHAHHAADVDLACGGEEVLAHHAHHGARNNAEVLLHGGPALDGGDGAVGLLHPAFDHCAEL